MIFQQKIVNLPRADDPALARELMTDFDGFSEEAARFLANVSASSSFLNGLISRQKNWLLAEIERPAKDVIADILEDAATPAQDEVRPALCLAKSRIALTLALLDLSGVWTLFNITETLTKFADLAVKRACEAAAQAVFKDPTALDRLIVLAMGKMGAGELNYSSDIDLIFLFDDRNMDPVDAAEAQANYAKLVRYVVKTLSTIDGDGYVFRTDIRLRPNPSVTFVCVRRSKAAEYYATEARTWERAAYIKARPCAGNLSAGMEFLKHVEPFLWRRGLNYSAVYDINDIHQKLREHKASDGAISVLGHDLKTGTGGIRDIEFFTQTRQLVAAGRDDRLRAPRTVDALAELAKKDWVPAQEAAELTEAYIRLREWEHRIQMMNDAQTHKVPASQSGLDRLAALDGRFDADAFSDRVLHTLQKVAELTNRDKPSAEDDKAEEQFPDQYQSRFDAWKDLPAMRMDRTAEIFDALAPRIVEHLNGSPEPEATLHGFDLFLSQQSSGLELFSLFEARPDILLLVLDLCSVSPNFARRLAVNRAVLDGLAFDSFFTVLPDHRTYAEMLAHTLREARDLEDQLNAMRRWHAEQHFQIIIQHIRGGVQVQAAERAYSDLAQATLQACLDAVLADLERRFGGIDGAEIAILAMGKMGSGEMTCQSDLDLIVVFDGPDGAVSDGAKQLDLRGYYARATKALINALSVPMGTGTLYEVDMRLRPSGRKGPVATLFSSFVDYQTNEAWTWEHLALSRACVLAGDRDLGERLTKACDAIISTAHDPQKVRKDVAEMRTRLRAADLPKAGSWPVKKAPGGLLDIELLAQSFALIGDITEKQARVQLKRAAELGLLKPEEAGDLIEAHRFFSKMEHLKRLMFDASFNIQNISPMAEIMILRDMEMPDIAALEAQMEQFFDCARGIIDTYLQDMG